MRNLEFKEEKKQDMDDDLDKIFKSRPAMIEKIRDNREFVEKIKKDDLPDTTMKVFGVKDVNVNAILKDNIWNRSIFTTDKLCRMFLGATLAQLKKYEAKKRYGTFEHWWLLILIFLGVGGIILVIIFLLPKLGNIGGII